MDRTSAPRHPTGNGRAARPHELYYNTGMRILMLAPTWPDPPRQGASIRNLHIALYLAARHRLTLLAFAQPGEAMASERLRRVCEHVEVVPQPTRTALQRLKTLLGSPLPDMAWRLHSEAMSRRVGALCSRVPFDAVHVEGIEMAPFGLTAVQLPPFINPRNPRARAWMTYDAHNAEYVLQRRAFTTDVRALRHPRRWLAAVYSLIQWWRLWRFERHVCLSSRHILAVSDADRAALERLSPSLRGRVGVLPNGVDTDYWSREAVAHRAVEQQVGHFAVAAGASSEPADLVVFDGTMDFRPNVDAVVWFAHKVWPLVRVERPPAHFFIVGRHPTPQVQALGDLPGITVTGAVDDVRPYVAAAKVYVVPVRVGGGTRLKLLQAMAMGCAIVSTSVGAEGVQVEHGRHLLIADAPQQFAQAVLSLLSDEARRQSLGMAARRLVTTRYTWQKLLPTLDAIYPPD